MISYSVFRQMLASFLDKVNADSVPIQITRKNGEHAVLMSLSDYRQMKETLYVLQNKSLSQQIEASEKTHRIGHGQPANQEVMDEIAGV